MSLIELLGSTVLGKGCVEQNTAEALKGKKAVALYFSAHWCPPCRGFTPKLAEWYEKDLKAKGLEVVFVTGDRDEDSFKEYFNEQPWLAVDFNAKETLSKLNKTFKVQGIPSLIILDADGKLITKDGREAVSKDPTGEDMPWIPPKAKDLVEKMKLTGPAGTMTLTEAMAGKQALALYFSAHWCPPCRGFTPQLAEWYMQDLKAKGLEVVFVSSDRDEAAFNEYFGEMPWLALDFSDRKLKEQLSSAFKVQGIPSLVVLDADYNVVTLKGRDAVTADPTGAELPWHPKPVSNLEFGPGDIEEVPTFLVFCETSSDEEKKQIEETMTSVAQKFVDKQKAEDAEFPDMAFIICKSNCALGSRLRTMFGMKNLPPAPHAHALSKKEKGPGWGCDGCGQDGRGKERYRCEEGCDFDFCGDCHTTAYSGTEAEKTPVQMVIVDIPSNGAYYTGAPGPVSFESIQTFVDGFKAGSLERKQLG